MAHIQLPEELPGIVGPLTFNPDTAKPLLELAEVLLRSPNTLTSAEREMIATYVSSQNDCKFCQFSHGAAAAEHLGGNYDLIDRLKLNFETAEVSNKLLPERLSKAANRSHRSILPALVSMAPPTKKYTTPY